MTITNELIRKFSLFLLEGEKSHATLEKYMRDVTAFWIWLDNCKLSKLAVLEYKEYLSKKYAPSSVNSVLSSLNSFFEYNGWRELKVKTLKIQRRIFADKEKELTKADYVRLLTAAKSKKNEKLYYLIQTIGSTGLRISELKYVTVEAINTGQAIINCKGKIRQVFLPKDLCKILKTYIKQQKITSGPIFVTRTGNPLDRSFIWKMMKSLCETAGVDKSKVFPHNLRHLFARTYYSIQKDIVRLADILGHSSINTTRIYTMETGDIHCRQIQRLGLLRL